MPSPELEIKINLLKRYPSGFMDKNSLGILQVNTIDDTGGAARIAWDLFKGYERKGFPSYFAVGNKQSTDPLVIPIMYNKKLKITDRFFNMISKKARHISSLRSSQKYFNLISHPSKIRSTLRGYENFDFPGTWQLLDLIPPFKPDIIHCHNLHGNYFDLRVLPSLSNQVPVVLTLHDAWLLSGHCAHSFACERWKTGCGSCPDLSIYPAIWKDATSYNWQRKAEIYKNSRFCVVTPSKWLMDKVNQSMLKTGIIAQKVIPNGVNQSVFHPANQIEARNALNLPTDVIILLFAANGIRYNIGKDYSTLQSALTYISTTGVNVLCIALGEAAHSEHIGNIEIRFVPYQQNQQIIARYFQAADVYVHPARAEVWGLTITEALSCGTPVVASAVGGIPEQIIEGKAGFLVPVGNAVEMAEKIMLLIINEELRQQMGQQAAKDAARRFSSERMAGDYLALYLKIINT